jgi:hypothetical protein
LYAGKLYKGEDYVLESDLLFKGIISLIDLTTVIVTAVIVGVISPVVTKVLINKLNSIKNFRRKGKNDYSVHRIGPKSQKQPNFSQLNSAKGIELQNEIEAYSSILQEPISEEEQVRNTNNLISARLELDKLKYS